MERVQPTVGRRCCQHIQVRAGVRVCDCASHLKEKEKEKEERRMTANVSREGQRLLVERSRRAFNYMVCACATHTYPTEVPSLVQGCLTTVCSLTVWVEEQSNDVFYKYGTNKEKKTLMLMFPCDNMIRYALLPCLLLNLTSVKVCQDGSRACWLEVCRRQQTVV